MQKITPFLWFDNNAEAAVNHYLSIFKNAKIVTTARYGDAGPGPKGSVMTIAFQLEGQDFIALNGSQPGQCGWLKDQFGLSWQITPSVLVEMLQDKDTEKSKRVMQAMLQMRKIDIAALRRAYEGN